MIGRMSLELGQGTGPLRGLKVVEIAGIGPGPHACMILADLGADVIRIDRPGGNPMLSGDPTDILNRGRPSVALDLKAPAAVDVVLRLVAGADVLVEGMRPGAAERLGIGPEDCHAVNPRLVYGRMTGWGQDGPWSHAAGHDLNYIATTGALFGMGQDQARPHFPSNLVGDFGGGSTYLVIGLLAALFEARLSGAGQVVDAAIVDGTAHLNAMASGLLAAGRLEERRGVNLLDGGLPYYDVYETADGRHLSVGALEPQFFAELVRLLDLPADAAGPGRVRAVRRAPHHDQGPHLGADACGVGGCVRRHRCVCGPGADAVRGRRASAHRRPRGVRRTRRRRTTCSRAALLSNRRVAWRRAWAARPAHSRRPDGLGHRRRGPPDRFGRGRPELIAESAG